MSAPPVGPSTSVFRPEALAELDAERQLDSRLRVVRPKAWITLVSVLGLLAAAVVWAVLGRAPVTVSGAGTLLPADGLLAVSAPAIGTVVEVPVLGQPEPGSSEVDVSAGTVLMVLQVTGGERVPVVSPVTGALISRAPLALGSTVTAGTTIGQILPYDSEFSALLFVDPTAGAMVQQGMAVRLSPSTAPAAAYGQLIGTVRSVDRLPYDAASLLQLAGGNEQLAGSLAAAGSLRVVVDLVPADTPSGYAWTSSSGPPFVIWAGTTLQGSVTVGERAPLTFLLGG